MLILFQPNARYVPLPDELISYILQFSSPLQVIHLRSVSKQFNRVINDDLRLWKLLYTNSCLPRPPGPFAWQSTKSLQRILIHSECLSRNWTTQAVDIITRTTGPNLSFSKGSPTLTSWNFLLGRLFVWCQRKQVIAQDTESNIRQVLWEGGRTIAVLDAHSLDLPDSQRVYIAIRHRCGRQGQYTPITLLEFPVQDTGPLLGPITWERELPIEAYLPFSPKSNSPLLKFERNDPATIGRKTEYLESLIVDVQSRRLYKFPAFSSGYNPVVSAKKQRPWWPADILLFGKHVISLYFWRHLNQPMTHIQVFAIPDSPASSDNSELRLTHEALCSRILPLPHCLISTVVSPVSGGIRLSYLGTTISLERTQFSCVTLAMLPALSAEVEYLSIDVQDLFTIETRQRHVFLEASDNGYARGLITAYSAMEPEYYCPRALYKFSIDASGERCKAVVSAKYDVEEGDALKVANRCAFDGVTGRLCYDVSGKGKDRGLVVLDLE